MSKKGLLHCMSNLPALLQFEHNEIRIVELKGDPWWFLSDVCRVLEIGNTSNAAARLDDDEKGTLDSIKGGPDKIIISEPGLYKLLGTSRKAIAKRFDRWVRHEVLPSIRKTGSYGSAVPEVASLIVSGLKEALAPLAIRFDGQDQAINRIERRQEDQGERLARVEGAIQNVLKFRRRISPKTKSEHLDAVTRLGCRCPVYPENIIVQGERIVDAEYDHHFANHLADVDHTWLISTRAHDDITRGRLSREEANKFFDAYHAQRRRLPGRQIPLF